MIVYLAGLLVVILLVRVFQEKIKRWGCSKGVNAAFTVVVCIILSLVLIGGTTMFSMVTWSRERKPVNIGSFKVGDKDYAIFYDRIPLYVQDFSKESYVEDSTRTIREIESILMSTGQYSQTLFLQGEEVERVTGLDYQVITVKADFMYDFALKCFWNQKFIFSEEGEKEKTEYRAVYESEKGTMYREYYDGLPMAYEWLVLTEDKIIPMTIFEENLSEEQMKIIVDKLTE
ncbi:MAG: hypothetical protein IJ274_11960 [Lachnospiraceae bacterium]|nr:hypothetical protein [Lachnospiraceae bacterium]